MADAVKENPWVTAGKGVVGGAAGAYGGYQANKASKATLKEQIAQNQALQDMINRIKGETVTGATAAYEPALQGYEGNLQDYLAKLQSTDYSKYDLTQPDEFAFDLNAATQAEMNPELQAIIDRSVQGAQQEAAAGGSLYSGATGKNIARTTADITAKEWDAARTRAQTEQANKYQQYLDKWNRQKDIATANKGNVTSQLAGEGAAVGIQQSAFEKQRGEITGAQNLANQNLLLNQQATGTAKSQLKGLPSGFGATVQGALGGISSALGG